jgi:rhodanese-related sulfurtransferase
MAMLIRVEDLHRLLASESRPTVVDVRDESAYVEGHVPGAIHIPGDDLAARMGEVPRGQPVVTY